MDNSSLTLIQLNRLIKAAINKNLPDMYWVQAETSDVRINQNGHCYLEFIEKDKQGKSVVAKTRAMIWANTFHLLRAYFENTTGQPFSSGIKVLVQVTIEYHELFGLSLVVQDLDPRFTIGDQALNRAAIIKQLEEDGVLALNKELELPDLPNRIAIISSPTAAGYEDFCEQLKNNKEGFVFYTKLFPSIMQGNRSEDSIIVALDAIYAHKDLFDAVVIIRGGGATSELSCFDSYLLAANCAQFPLPVITGIGHERDDTVLDIVAYAHAKTPTAVAEFLIDKVQLAYDMLLSVKETIISDVNLRMQNELLKLSTYETGKDYFMRNWNKQQLSQLETISISLKRYVQQLLKQNLSSLDTAEKHLRLISPDNVLKRGYTLTLKGDKVLKNYAELKVGDEITTVFKNGKIDSIVK